MFLKLIFSDTPEHELLSDIVMDPKRLKDVGQLSPVGQTSCLESFHARINHYAPKMYHFSYESMETRYVEQILQSLSKKIKIYSI